MRNPAQNTAVQRRGLTPVRIVMTYAVVGGLWIFSSDTILGSIVQDPAVLTRVSVAKGWLFIAVTACILFFLIRRSHAELGKSQVLLNSVVEGTSDAIYVKDARGRYLLFNSGAEVATGKVSAEVLGKDDTFLFPPQEAATVMEGDRAVMNGRTRQTYEENLTTASGEKTTYLSTKGPLFDDRGRVIGLFGIARDIADRKRVEEALRESEARYRRLHESMMDAFVRVDMSARILEWNRAYQEMVGYSTEELRRMTYEDLTPERWHEAEALIIREQTIPLGYSGVYEKEYIRKDGTVFPVELRNFLIRDEEGRPLSMWAIVRDITDRKRAEEEKEKLEAQLLQAQKMEAVGQLAGGVAHDFNNLLTAIIGYCHLAQAGMQADDPHQLYLDHILASAERAANLTQSLLAFSRKQVLSPKNVDLNDIIRKVEKFLSRVIRADIELGTSLAPEELLIYADTTQIEQVVMNLATNARDAMPQGGRLTVETGRAKFDAELARARGFGQPGSYAVLSVSDTGTGMDEKTREKIFEPFFTTKEVGRGTGLGLSIVYGIVKQHNGEIRVSSETGNGTTFRIYLPLVGTAAQGGETDGDVEQPEDGTETILLAEDSAAVRELTKRVLERHGYSVIEAADGEEALAKFAEHRDSIQLLVLDVIMPKKNGREVCAEAGRMRPGIKTLFTSGYPADLIRKEGLLEGGLHLIPKPATPAELLRKVRQVLDS